jgi:arabinose-5-phosphate isomerase
MNTLEIAKEVIEIEILGLRELVVNLTEDFDRAVDAILESHGKTIICGMGKSGIIGKKIASSFASTGTSSFFMHPGEAFHGDLGMVMSNDIFVAISNSGETDEVLRLLPFLRNNQNIIIAITGNPNSTLAKNANFYLNVAVPMEACHLQLAPTASTTAALVMGDALTVALMKKRGFQAENFARFHPGGSLGRRLLGKVSDETQTDNLPFVTPDTDMAAVINVISNGQLGLALVKENENFIGIITDGDLRRAIEKYNKDVFDMCALNVYSKNPITIMADVSLQKAYDKMDRESVNCLVVNDSDGFLGIFKK